MVAQGNKPASPPGEATLKFDDGKTVTIQYSRPSMRGRKIFGGLVPYDEVWRTGANAATSLKTDVALTIGGANVPAGSYTLYTLPGANELEADHQQADRTVGHRIQPRPRTWRAWT